MRLGLIVVAVVGLAGCQRPRWDTPVDAFHAFEASLKRGDARGAWDGISKDSRGRIEARLKAVSKASGGVVPETDAAGNSNAAAMALATGLKAESVGEVTLKETNGDTAVVLVKIEDAQREQRMVREDGKWRLDLLPLLPET